MNGGMFKKILREMYMLPRGEQRAIIVLSLLLLLSIAIRIVIESLPPKAPPGLDKFIEETRILMDESNRLAAMQRIDLNRADSLELLPLPGIGPVFASRIIRYRNLLGGFVSHDQLREVYGLPAETAEMLHQKTLIDTTAIRKINLDSVSFRELLRHPYFQIELVRELMEFRELMGPIRSTESLKINNLVSDSILQRISPYLKWGS
jgi:DNA uptake protein ComE-like DNA-binding protein